MTDPISNLNGKNILLGVTGGIAAYKSVSLVRLLQKQGATVRVMMTASAQQFVTALTFQAISGLPVHTDLLDTEAEKAMGHIELARWADAILIAPCTANTLAKLANGEADDLLTTVCIASTAARAIAPAMNQAMWLDKTTQQNLQLIKQNGYQVFGPASGEQACGETGEGRLLEPEQLLQQLDKLFSNELLAGTHIVITAGPTHEPIDPVRFIGNRSSGRMGYELAAAAREAGARVSLISGPSCITAPEKVDITYVQTAQQMFDAVQPKLNSCAIFIGVAAVADYRPLTPSAEKIKKHDDELTLSLVKNPDILASVAAHSQRPFTVGFAAETSNLLDYAQQKIEAKSLDMIIANRVDQQDAGFNSLYNAATVLWPENKNQSGQSEYAKMDFDKMTKTQLARELINLIAGRYLKYYEQNTTKSS